MTNTLVGDVYQKIIEDVIVASSTDFEESGVSQSTLQELQREWQTKLSQRGVAQMPWDPKPQPTPTPQPQSSAASNGASASYTKYETPPSTAAVNGTHIKTEPGTEQAFNGLPNGYPQNTGPSQGGLARAQHLVQQQYGPNASASLNAMQRAGGGLALPGQQQAKPQGLHLPGQNSPPTQAQYSPQQQAAMLQQQQQRLQQQQQIQPQVKVENDSPQLTQGAFSPQTQPAPANYSQTDGADDAYEQWQEMLAQRRATSTQQLQHADRMMRESILQQSAALSSGLMVPLDEQQASKRPKLAHNSPIASSSTSTSLPRSNLPPQLDGDYSDDEDVKDEDDENAINSDLDDSDDDVHGPLGDDDDDGGDQILCTYDKVQRVKNKWKCTLKDGVMSVGGKDWVFHKATGEFEW